VRPEGQDDRTRDVCVHSKTRDRVEVLVGALWPRSPQWIAHEPIRGSWWSHPKSREIFWITQAVRDSDEVLVCRLMDAKNRFIHRQLWPALVRLRVPVFPASAVHKWKRCTRHIATAPRFPKMNPPGGSRRSEDHERGSGSGTRGLDSAGVPWSTKKIGGRANSPPALFGHVDRHRSRCQRSAAPARVPQFSVSACYSRIWPIRSRCWRVSISCSISRTMRSMRRRRRSKAARLAVDRLEPRASELAESWASESSCTSVSS
jgi:hypothetical protein